MCDSEISYQQANRFLTILDAMNPEAQRAFRKIYTLAPKGGHAKRPSLSGQHVRVAMVESLAHPQIAYWVRMNLAVRVARKFCQTAGRPDKVERLNALLEAFHIAADAFVLKLSVDLAVEHRLQLKARSQQERSQTGAAFPFQLGTIAVGLSEQDVDRIQAFKQTVIPGFIGAIRRKLSA